MSKDFAEPIDRLIQHYETHSHLLELLTTLFEAARSSHLNDPHISAIANGPAKHWKEYRKHLTRIHVDGFDYGKFVGMPIWQGAKPETYPRQRILAAQVASWTKSSRRIYHVPEDLQLLLAATTLDDVNWDMVRWPFESFLITFDLPLLLDGEEIDSILVSDEFSDKRWEGRIKSILALPKKLKTQKEVFLGDQSDRIQKAIEKKDFEYAREKIHGIIANRLDNLAPEQLIIKSDAFSEGGFAGAFEKQVWKDVGMQKVLRLTFGLLLYLQSLPSSVTAPRGWEPQKPGDHRNHSNKITLAAEVCNVASVYKLTEKERSVFRVGLRSVTVEVSPHYREGHWRRPPGKGIDPNHPKTVWVRPTIVRMDKLEDGGLPGGSKENL